MQINVYCSSNYLFVYQTFVYFFLRCIDPAAEIEPDQTYDESDAEGEALGPEDDSGALADPSTLYVLFYFLVYQIFVYKILFTFFSGMELLLVMLWMNTEMELITLIMMKMTTP